MSYRAQTGRIWIDAQGREVPIDHIDPLQRRDEKRAKRLMRKAMKIRDQLAQFKRELANELESSYQERLTKSAGSPTGARGHSIYSFDKKIKFSRQRAQSAQFDEALVAAAQEKFEQFIQIRTRGDHATAALIRAAFDKSGGKLDAKRLLQLHSYRQQIADPLFDQALDLLDQATSIDYTRDYLQIYERDDTGEYQSILLNLSAL